MDRDQFDRLCCRIEAHLSRRGALGVLTALALTTSVQRAPANAGDRRGRRKARRDRRRDDRQDRRDERRNRPPRGRPPGYDCSKPDSQGKPCLLDALGGVVTRCCNGACPDPATATCIGRRGWTGVRCDDTVGSPCRDADRLCCSGSAWCDDEEGECACWYGDPGDTCVTDDDCHEMTPACVCGYCR